MKDILNKKYCYKLLLILSMIIVLLAICQVKVNAEADNPIGDNNINFLDEDYWEWHTRTTTGDMAYNGKHIEISDAIDFYGYGVTSYKDFLYKDYEYAGKKIFAFQIDETKGNYHTLDGAGFIFNAKNDDGELTGDVLLITQNMIYIYRLENVNIASFETTSNRDVKSYAKTLLAQVNKPNAVIHNLVITTSPVNVTISDNGTEILNLDLDASTHAGEDFGLLVSYLQHSCSVLTNIKFLQFNLKLEDYQIPVYAHEKESRKSVEGVSFDLVDEKGQVIRSGKTDKDGLWNINGVTSGTYTLNITEIPEGYTSNKKTITFKITTDGKAVDTETDEEISLDIILKKKKYEVPISVIDDKKQGIQGLIFTITKKDGTEIGKSETDANGKIKFEGEAGESYIIKNISAPDGYEVDDKQYEFKISDDGKIIDIETEKEISIEMLVKKSEQSSLTENTKKDETKKTTGVLPNAGVGYINLITIGVLVFVLCIKCVQSIYIRNKYRY